MLVTRGFFLFGALVCILALSPRARAQELFGDATDATASTVERVYVKGLQYLVRTQTKEGSWPEAPYGREPAVVGFAVMAMLAHGDDPNVGPYAPAIRSGLNFILENANAQTGYIGRSMYNHGFATLALAEAYGMVDDPRLGPALQRAVNLILTSQSKNPMHGWRYSPESVDADTTVSGAQMVALFAARNAGLAVPEEAIQKGLKFFITCQTPEGGFGYTQASGPNAARTAIGCLVFALAKEKSATPYKNAYKFLQRAPADTHYQQYYLYYAAQAYFHHSPEAWNEWNRRNITALSSTQSAEGSWEGHFGSTFGTAASLLSLALNYRYLPIYER